MQLQQIAIIRSTLVDRKGAPRQGPEGAPDAWLEVDPQFADALHGVAVGDELIVVTWFHQANRETMKVYPRGDRRNMLTGVFATRSPDRPNPIGLHPVTVRSIDGTPVIDIKIAQTC